MNEVALLIGGKSLPAQSRRFYDRMNPVKNTVATWAAAAGVFDVDGAVAAASAAFRAASMSSIFRHNLTAPFRPSELGKMTKKIPVQPRSAAGDWPAT